LARIMTSSSTDSPPEVVFGMPTYRHVGKLPETLDSLLGQTVARIAIVAVDDGSDDGTFEMLRRYAAKDPRLTVYRNDRRLGYTRNANRALALAREAHPEAAFFAWGSDHDVWHPRWVEKTLACLKENPEAPIAWTWFDRIDADGTVVSTRNLALGRGASADVADRMRFAASEVAASSCLHGLIRLDALDRTGGLCLALVPDRLLIAELGTVGPFAQVEEVLWSRRYFGLVSRQRQRRASFPDGGAHFTYLPITVQHFLVLARDYAWRGLGRPRIGRLRGLRLAYAYAHERVRSLTERRLASRKKARDQRAKDRQRAAKQRRRDLKAAGRATLGTRLRGLRKRLARAGKTSSRS